jgi:hypothetical protein
MPEHLQKFVIVPYHKSSQHLRDLGVRPITVPVAKTPLNKGTSRDYMDVLVAQPGVASAFDVPRFNLESYRQKKVILFRILIK